MCKTLKEEWRGVIYQGVDYSDRYEVSNLGNFRNTKTKKLIKLTVQKSGYYGYCASLGSRGKYKFFKTHRAVAESFIPNPNGHAVINHIDGNKLNNQIDNLEWCTYQHNYNHAVKLGLMQNNFNSKQKAIEKMKKKVRGINIKTNDIRIFASTSDAAKFLGDITKRTHISDVANGKRKIAYGYKWEWI